MIFITTFKTLSTAKHDLRVPGTKTTLLYQIKKKDKKMVETVLIAILVFSVLAFLAAVTIIVLIGSAMQLDLEDMDYNYDD